MRQNSKKTCHFEKSDVFFAHEQLTEDNFFPSIEKTVQTNIGGRHAHDLPLSTMQVQIREMATRWGSCTPLGNIFFNWRCVMTPLFVLDYLIVHELIHLEYPDHSRDFWSRVSEILPEYGLAKDWLTNNGVRTEL